MVDEVSVSDIEGGIFGFLPCVVKEACRCCFFLARVLGLRERERARFSREESDAEGESGS